MTLTAGQRVCWESTDHKGRVSTVRGVVEGEGPHGRLAVRGDDGGLHHVQLAWVWIDTTNQKGSAR